MPFVYIRQAIIAERFHKLDESAEWKPLTSLHFIDDSNIDKRRGQSIPRAAEEKKESSYIFLEVEALCLYQTSY
ncbi:hypothetical protein HNY73_011946 [Argiope bruennichi]|uniref:Uncharacterized protein n=1 Tax=Argiope bruennichi TaxID=94029 RepID=A0A8T0ETK3_ARGBR|nr:hypothetical protein HNY73_011946 [Argiope bruennichi]